MPSHIVVGAPVLAVPAITAASIAPVRIVPVFTVAQQYVVALR
jgi:hypothetical protein